MNSTQCQSEHSSRHPRPTWSCHSKCEPCDQLNSVKVTLIPYVIVRIWGSNSFSTFKEVDSVTSTCSDAASKVFNSFYSLNRCAPPSAALPPCPLPFGLLLAPSVGKTPPLLHKRVIQTQCFLFPSLDDSAASHLVLGSVPHIVITSDKDVCDHVNCCM